MSSANEPKSKKPQRKPKNAMLEALMKAFKFGPKTSNKKK
jgi:hypothetical protein